MNCMISKINNSIYLYNVYTDFDLAWSAHRNNIWTGNEHYLSNYKTIKQTLFWIEHIYFMGYERISDSFPIRFFVLKTKAIHLFVTDSDSFFFKNVISIRDSREQRPDAITTFRKRRTVDLEPSVTVTFWWKVNIVWLFVCLLSKIKIRNKRTAMKQ